MKDLPALRPQINHASRMGSSGSCSRPVQVVNRCRYPVQRHPYYPPRPQLKTIPQRLLGNPYRRVAPINIELRKRPNSIRDRPREILTFPAARPKLIPHRVLEPAFVDLEIVFALCCVAPPFELFRVCSDGVELPDLFPLLP